MDTRQILITIFGSVWLLLVVIVLFALPAWLRALRGGAAIPVAKIVAMRLQGFNMSVIVAEYVRARKEGADVTVDEVAALWRKSPRTFQADVQSLIAAKRSTNHQS